LAALAAAVLAVLFVPLPSSIHCAVDVKPRDAAHVYVDVPGQLAKVLVAPGDVVAVGQPLCRLANVDLELAVARLEGERNEARSRLASLEQQRFRDEHAGLEIEHTRESLAALEVTLAAKLRDRARLELAAPAAGTVIPPPLTPDPKVESEELPTWSGTPFLPRNVGATLAESTLFCQIGDPRALEAVLVVDQADIERIAVGQPVEILLDEFAGERHRGAIAEVAQQKLDVSAARLSHKSGGELTTKTDATGVERPESASYQALVPLNDPQGVLRQGLRGRAKVHAHWETLATRGWRYLTRTFQFEL
jgi:putative peptide zinc metalloprotease protein